MKRLLLCLVVTVVVAPFAAQADEMPARKAGLWEITMKTERAGTNVIQLCIDAATDANSRELGRSASASMCSRNEMHRSGNVVTADAVCQIGRSKTTTHTMTTFDGDVAYSVVALSHYDPPTRAGLSDSRITQEGKWVGSCGADMKPGDMMIQGRKMHLPNPD